MLKYGLNYIKEHISKGIKSYLGDQEVISISLRIFKNISKGIYSLPLYTVGIPPENIVKTLCMVHPIHCNKEYSLKERLLYYIDEKRYYTSSKNRYILFSRNTINQIRIVVCLIVYIKWKKDLVMKFSLNIWKVRI